MVHFTPIKKVSFSKDVQVFTFRKIEAQLIPELFYRRGDFRHFELEMLEEIENERDGIAIVEEKTVHLNMYVSLKSVERYDRWRATSKQDSSGRRQEGKSGCKTISPPRIARRQRSMDHANNSSTCSEIIDVISSQVPSIPMPDKTQNSKCYCTIEVEASTCDNSRSGSTSNRSPSAAPCIPKRQESFENAEINRPVFCVEESARAA